MFCSPSFTIFSVSWIYDIFIMSSRNAARISKELYGELTSYSMRGNTDTFAVGIQEIECYHSNKEGIIVFQNFRTSSKHLGEPRILFLKRWLLTPVFFSCSHKIQPMMKVDYSLCFKPDQQELNLIFIKYIIDTYVALNRCSFRH